MALTEQLIQESLAENPENAKLLQDALRAQGFTVVAQTDYEGLVKTEVDRLIGSKVSEIYSNIDKDVSEFGIPKNQNEKTYDYIKRVLGTQTEKEKQLNAKIEELQSKSPDDMTKKEVEDLRKLLAERDGNITQLQTRIEQQSVGYEIASAMAIIPINKNLPPIALNSALEKIQGDVMKMARKDENGIIFYVGADGSKLLDTSTGLPKTAQQILLERLQAEQLLEVKANTTGGTGTGTPKPVSLNIAGVNGKALSIPSDVKTDAEFTDWASKNEDSLGRPFTSVYNQVYLAWKKNK